MKLTRNLSIAFLPLLFLALVAPALVYLPLWRPDGGAPEPPERAWFYAGVGRQPA